MNNVVPNIARLGAKAALGSVALACLAGGSITTNAFAQEAPKCADPAVLELVLKNLNQNRALSLPPVFGDITLDLRLSAPTTQGPTPANNGWYCLASGKIGDPVDPKQAAAFQAARKMRLINEQFLSPPLTVYYKILKHDADDGYTVWASLDRMPK